jgi:hypothetical protein
MRPRTDKNGRLQSAEMPEIMGLGGLEHDLRGHLAGN